MAAPTLTASHAAPQSTAARGDALALAEPWARLGMVGAPRISWALLLGSVKIIVRTVTPSERTH